MEDLTTERMNFLAVHSHTYPNPHTAFDALSHSEGFRPRQKVHHKIATTRLYKVLTSSNGFTI
jgi:hypothetical protein